MFGQLFLLAETGASIITWLVGLAALAMLVVLCLLCWYNIRRQLLAESILGNLATAAEELRRLARMSANSVKWLRF